jgi:predicted DNA-binding transcriptional regulator YafY
MGKRAGTLETTLLAIELLRRIPRNRKVTAEELHAQVKEAGFERDLRTIQRQLDLLSEHFKLDRDTRNKPYGYSWPKNSEGLSVPGLNLKESLLLRLAEEHLRNLLPTHLLKSMDGFFAQARQNLDPVGPPSLEREWPNKVRVVATSQPLLPPKIDPAVFEAVCEALYGNRFLDVAYKNASGTTTKGRIKPLGLAQQGPRMYLICRFDGYEDNRALAIHRIQQASGSTLTFKRPKDFSLKQYDDDGRFGFGDGKRVRLTFRIKKDYGYHVLESKLSEDQVFKEIGDDYEITASVVDSSMLEWWLRGFGGAVSAVRRRVLKETAS